MAQPRRGSREAREEVQRDRDGVRWRREDENERDRAVEGDKLANEPTNESTDQSTIVESYLASAAR